MCVVSMVADHYRDMWRYKDYFVPFQPVPPAGPSKQDFDELKRQVAEMIELLKRARAYDLATGQPDCELDEKMELLRKAAALVGVDLDAVLAQKAAEQTNIEIVNKLGL